MILWRPTINNLRYAFTPLLDNPEDEDDGIYINILYVVICLYFVISFPYRRRRRAIHFRCIWCEMPRPAQFFTETVSLASDHQRRGRSAVGGGKYSTSDYWCSTACSWLGWGDHKHKVWGVQNAVIIVLHKAGYMAQNPLGICIRRHFGVYNSCLWIVLCKTSSFLTISIVLYSNRSQTGHHFNVLLVVSCKVAETACISISANKYAIRHPTQSVTHSNMYVYIYTRTLYIYYVN